MKLREYSIVFILLFLQHLALANPSLQAPITVTGKVYNAETELAIAGAVIYNGYGSFLAESDAQGQFTFETRVNQEIKMNVFSIEYALYELKLTPSKDTFLHVALKALSQSMNTVVILGQSEKLNQLRSLRSVEGTAIYAGKKTEVVSLDQSVGNLASNNARQIYAQIAGLNIFEGNGGGMQLSIGGRGLDPNRSASFNTRQNGYDISADVLGYPESYYTPPAEALEEIQVVRGAASLQYGTQFGGLVNFKMKKPNAKKKLEVNSRQTLGSFGLFTSFNSLSGTKGKLSYYTYFNYKKGDGFRPNSHFDSRNFFAHFGYKFNSKTKLIFEATYLHYLAQQAGGITDAQFYRDPTFSNRSRNWFQVDWHLLSLRLNHKFNTRTEFSLNVFALDASRKAIGFRTNRVSQTDDLSAPRDLLVGTFRNWGMEPRFITKYRILERPAAFLIGGKLYQSNNTSQQGAGSNGLDADFEFANQGFPQYPNQSSFTFPNFNVAAFVENVIWLSPKFTLTPGIRFEHIVTRSMGTYRVLDFDLAGNAIRDASFSDNRQLPRTFVLAGLGLSYKPTECVELFGNLSQNYRSVTFNDIRVVNPSYQIDPNLNDEHGFTTDIGLRGLCQQFISYDLGLFGIMYNDRIGEVLRLEERVDANGHLEPTGRLVRYRGNIGRAFIHGLEANVSFDLKQLLLIQKKNLKLDVFVNGALTRSKYLESEMAGIVGNSVEFVPLLNVKTGIKFGYKNFLANLQFTYLSEQFTDASNAPQRIADNQRGIEGSIPAYYIMDLSISYTYKRYKLETGINNLMSQSYFTRRATGYPGPGIIPSDPISGYVTLGVRI